MPADGPTGSPPDAADSPPTLIVEEEDLGGQGIAEPSGHPFGATFRSLRHRNYRLYFFGQLISLTGSWMQTPALAWLAYEATGKSAWPAWIAASQFLPTFLLGAWAGGLADRWSKRALLFGTQTALLILAVVLAALVYFGMVSPWVLLTVTAATGLVQAVDLPARLAFVTDMVSRDDVMNAVALNSLLFNVARAIGPALAGILLVTYGPWPCFLANGLSYIALLAGLVLMDLPLTPRRDRCAPRVPASGGGFVYLLQRPALAMLVVLAAVLTFCAWPFLSLLPALAERSLQTGAQGYSSMLSGTGFGALAAALTVATFGTFARRRLFLNTGVCIIGAALAGLSWVESLEAGVVCCALVGFGLILFFPTSQAVVQLSASDYNRGRLMGIWAMVQSGALPLGNLLAGPAADAWGERHVLRTEGLTCAAAALIVIGMFVMERMKSAKRLSEKGVRPPKAKGSDPFFG
jgi:MFS family permease